MDFTVLLEFFEVLVVVACLIVGYIIKKWVVDVENKYIPTILAVFGAVFNVVVSGISVENIVWGALMGLASTGLHQAFTRFVEKGEV
jgi:prepilin signal peptidase PulO-like enzyme (type II secretory pathway)